MGRPRKQTVDYFPHFVSTDSKTKFILEESWGNNGYAFWFKLLELLGRSEGHYYDCSAISNKKYLVALMKIEQDTIDEILETLADLGNIDKELWEERKVIWCQSLVDNLQDVYSKRTVSAPKRPFTEQTEEQEEKPPEDKPKKRGRPKKSEAKPKRKSVLSAEQQALFEKFYAAYPKKVDRATAERAWAKIDPTPDEAMTEKIIQAVEASKKYDSRFRERQYIPNPASWLNAKGYENEYTQEGGNNYGGFNPDRGHNSQPTGGPGGFKPSGGFKKN
nr:MAG: protein of unknown function DUF4373 [Bacteriophage sp.]